MEGDVPITVDSQIIGAIGLCADTSAAKYGQVARIGVAAFSEKLQVKHRQFQTPGEHRSLERRGRDD